MWHPMETLNLKIQWINEFKWRLNAMIYLVLTFHTLKNRLSLQLTGRVGQWKKSPHQQISTKYYTFAIVLYNVPSIWLMMLFFASIYTFAFFSSFTSKFRLDHKIRSESTWNEMKWKKLKKMTWNINGLSSVQHGGIVIVFLRLNNVTTFIYTHIIFFVWSVGYNIMLKLP